MPSTCKSIALFGDLLTKQSPGGEVSYQRQRHAGLMKQMKQAELQAEAPNPTYCIESTIQTSRTRPKEASRKRNANPYAHGRLQEVEDAMYGMEKIISSDSVCFGVRHGLAELRPKDLQILSVEIALPWPFTLPDTLPKVRK